MLLPDSIRDQVEEYRNVNQQKYVRIYSSAGLSLSEPFFISSSFMTYRLSKVFIISIIWISAYSPVMPDPARTIANFDRHLFVHVRNHPEIRFDLFLPPYNIYLWCLLREQGKLEPYLHLRDVFARMAAEYPNVRIYDFQAEFDIVCSLDVYKDVTHYSPKINTRIIQDIGSARHIFPLAEFRRRTALIRSRSAEFQPAFDELRRKKP